MNLNNKFKIKFMKIKSSYLLLVAVAGLLLTGCKKYKFEEQSSGVGIVKTGFRLTAPANNTTLVLNTATPTAPVVITWGAAASELGGTITYKWVAVGRIGNIDFPALSIASDNGGKDNKLTLTYKAIIDVFKANGLPLPQTPVFKLDMIWSVVADNGTTTTRCEDVYNISFSFNPNGASPFVLLSPVSKAENVTINPGSTTDSLKFNWTKSKPGNPANAVKYKVWFGTEGQIATPKFSMNSNNGGNDSLLSVSFKDFSDSLVKYGYPLTDLAKLQWTVTATSGTTAPAIFTQFADFPNTLYILREVKMFLVGDITGWDINNPFELIADPASSRTGKVFYTYFKVTTTAQFLFIKEKGNWGSKYGITGGSAPTYDIGYNTGGDFFITTPGIYRLTIDAGNMKAHIQQKQVGLVGQFQGWNPGTPNTGGYLERDKFIILQNINLTDEFKFHDGPVWDNSSPDKARWWGKGSTAGTLDNDGNGANLKNEVGTAGLIRCIWDGTDKKKVTYSMTNGGMYLIGSATNGGWDNQAGQNDTQRPPLTYMGNGVWQGSVPLTAGELKFIVLKGSWDFNYGGSAGKISQGGSNIAIAAPGTYTITVDEYNQTYTIN
jgi:starch-binding outer membrane protein SusE/F